MTPTEAADKLRPTFSLEHMPPEDRHHVLFVEAVAAELGVEPTPFNLQQVATALDDADIRGDDLHFPLMLYSRQHHAVEGVPASTYYPRHDMVFVTVENEEQMQLLGKNWVENPADMPARGEIPIDAPAPKSVDLPKPDDGYVSADGSYAHKRLDHDEMPVDEYPAHSSFEADKAVVDSEKHMHSDDTESVAAVDNSMRDADAERQRILAARGAAQESLGYATQEGRQQTADMGRGTAADGTSTRRVPDAPQGMGGGPTNMKPVKNDIN